MSSIRSSLKTWRYRYQAHSFRSRLQRYLATGCKEPGDYESMLSAFILSGGSEMTWGQNQIEKSIEAVDFTMLPDFLGIASQPGLVSKIGSQLRETGFVALPGILPRRAVEELTNCCSNSIATLVSDDPLIDGRQSPVDFNSVEAEKYLIPTSELLKTQALNNLLRDQGLYRVAQEYLGTSPILDSISAWFSFPSKASSAAGQIFHFDFERIRWLKVFIYLTDVTEETGAHVFVPTTHRDGAIPPKTLRRGYERLSDDVVEQIVSSSRWETISGPAGTVLFEDTRGLHKGLPVVRDHRLVLEFQFAQILFGGQSRLVDEWSTLSDIAREVPCLARAMSPSSL